ncbi:MAG: flagellar basal body protein FliL [Rhodobacterales bacterium]|nr:MAG: flagellar basal body protein FliL [Rhodobacterales bacterium]
MADEPETEPEEKKSGKLGLILGLVLGIALGAGAFFAVYNGLVFGGEPSAEESADHDTPAPEPLAPIAFVPLEPLVVSLGPTAGSRHLRFRAELEVAPGAEEIVTHMLPRVMDVLNSYLRAVSVTELEDPGALIELRLQMLRRIRLVVGEEYVRDLLIMEFVLS